jgi:hypothetical protein
MQIPVASKVKPDWNQDQDFLHIRLISPILFVVINSSTQLRINLHSFSKPPQTNISTSSLN